MYNLALDRIEAIEAAEDILYYDKEFDADRYFGEVIGATVSENQRPQNVFFFVTKRHAPYVATKPFHHSQVIIKEDDEGTTFKICVQLNFELERMILGMGEFLTVLKPNLLVRRIAKCVSIANNNYSKMDIDSLEK